MQKSASFHCYWSCLLLLIASSLSGQDVSAKPYTLKVPVDAVSITFHATGASGRALGELSPNDIDLFDNENGPGNVIAVERLKSHSVRMVFLMDTSESVSSSMARNDRVAAIFGRRLLGDGSNAALIAAFAGAKRVVQPWTKDHDKVVEVLGTVRSATAANAGTSLFGALFSTCFYDFDASEDNDGQRVILLFSDGIDTSSKTSLEAAVDVCQRSHAVVYAIQPPASAGQQSTGPAVLARLTNLTGGRLLHADSDPEIAAAAASVADDLHNEYRLFYRPNHLSHDGSFHKVVLVGSSRVSRIGGQSGYFAPTP